jgi:2-phosphosulfolactate phosphatase
VLSFSTTVDIAVSNRAMIFPYKFKDETSMLYSVQVRAELASLERSKSKYSLSPASLLEIAPETKLVLPSPNGSELSLSTGSIPTLCACLRNSRSVAEYALSIGENITVIPAGEKWEDGSLRFALEDYLGAGAVISNLKGKLSAESKAAMDMFNLYSGRLHEAVAGSFSGIELIEKGYEEDVALASLLNVSTSVPLLGNNLYRNANQGSTL